MMKLSFLSVIIAICLSVVTSSLIDPDYHKINRGHNRTWEEAIAIAKALVAQMTLEEKCGMTAGIPSPCAGTVTPIPRLNFPGLCLIDSPSGVHTGLFSTAFPPGIHTAAAWDRDLTYKRASAIGKEYES
jgi:beta-glucosidase